METRGIVSEASILIDAPREKVWEAVVTPALIKQYMMGSDVDTDWQVGSPIVWKGEYEGKKYEDKGEILQMEPEKLVQYTHDVKPDAPEKYHIVTVRLDEEEDGQIRLTITQDNNPDEAAREYTTEFWENVVEQIKEIVE